MPPSPALPLMLAAALFAGGCAPDNAAPAPSAQTEVKVPKVPGNEACLFAVWDRQAQRDVAFDRAHDAVRGGSIACTTGTSASRFAAALTPLVTAARRNDHAALVREAGLPLTYIDATGERRSLATRDEVRAAAPQVFDAEMRAALAAMTIEDVAVADGGGSFALGTIWLVAQAPGATPRLVTLNRQALRESRAAALAAGG